MPSNMLCTLRLAPEHATHASNAATVCAAEAVERALTLPVQPGPPPA